MINNIMLINVINTNMMIPKVNILIDVYNMNPLGSINRCSSTYNLAPCCYTSWCSCFLSQQWQNLIISVHHQAPQLHVPNHFIYLFSSWFIVVNSRLAPVDHDWSWFLRGWYSAKSPSRRPRASGNNNHQQHWSEASHTTVGPKRLSSSSMISALEQLLNTALWGRTSHHSSRKTTSHHRNNLPLLFIQLHINDVRWLYCINCFIPMVVTAMLYQRNCTISMITH